MLIPFRKLLLLLIASALIIGPGALIGGAQDCMYNEAPMLAEMVAAGDLPGVCDRLPDNPLVVASGVYLPESIIVPEVGQYGGELLMTWQNNVAMKETLFNTLNRDDNTIAPNIIEEFIISDDASEYTFKLRAGHKWSDGAPVTTEDVRFAYEDVLSNAELRPSVPTYLKSGNLPDGAPATLTIVDDTTFKFSFDGAYPGFAASLVSLGTGYLDIIKPAHFLAQFHSDYGDADEIAAMVEEGGLESWVEVFNAKDVSGWCENCPQAIGFPQLGPWVRVEGPEEEVVTSRNPYYFAVDADGNQLPYLDGRRAVINQWGIMETAELMMFAGDVHYFWTTSLANLPLFIENEENGNYTTHVYPNKDSRMFHLNLTFADETWREVTWDARFRNAVMLAFDSEELINAIYYGQASLPTIAPSDYDVDGANAMLDDMGMTERDADGYRQSPSGEPFSIMIEVGAGGGDYSDPAPFFVDYLGDIGVKADFRNIDSALLGERRASNEMQAGINWNTAPLFAAHTFPDYIPNNNWGPLWGQWYADNSTGEEPPDWIKDLYAVHEDLISHPPGSDGFIAASAARDAWLYDNVPFFTHIEQPGIVHMWSNCLANVPDGPFHHGSWSSHRLIYFTDAC